MDAMGIDLQAMKWTAPVTYFLLATAACTSVFFVSALRPTSTGAFAFFAIWLTLPYAIMAAALILLQRKCMASFHWHVVAIIVSTAGMLYLADVIFWHPDAQGAIAVLITPLFQAGALVLVLPVSWWLSRTARAKQRHHKQQ